MIDGLCLYLLLTRVLTLMSSGLFCYAYIKLQIPDPSKSIPNPDLLKSPIPSRGECANPGSQIINLANPESQSPKNGQSKIPINPLAPLQQSSRLPA